MVGQNVWESFVKEVEMSTRVQIGCGKAPMQGWQNYDNSWSIRLARRRLLTATLAKLRLLTRPQKEFISFAAATNIKWAEATRHIPEPDNSVEALYACHMLEHLTKKEAKMFLKEAGRVLRHGGIIRIVVPNLRYFVDNYLNDDNADNFIKRTLLTRERPQTLSEKFRNFIVGERNHQWMYDGHSLCKLLLSMGFRDAHVVQAGSTMIPEPGKLNLMERSDESVFVEAINP